MTDLRGPPDVVTLEMPEREEEAGSETEKDDSDEDDDNGLPELIGDDSDDDHDHDDDDDDDTGTWRKLYSQKATGRPDIHIEGSSGIRNKPNFTGPKPGPSNQSRKYARKTPLNCLQLFWSEAILACFVVATNAYAKLFMSVRWRKDIDVNEFKGFLAIILFFGIIKYPSREDAWKSQYSSPFVSNIMTYDRFKAISAAWHWENYGDLVPEGEPNRPNRVRAAAKAKKKGDAFWPVKSLVVRLNAAFRLMWNPHQRVDLDEQSIGFKGRHAYRCYNPSKPDKYHFKMFAVNDSETKYQYCCYLYEGSQSPIVQGQTATSMPIYNLIYTNEEFHNNGTIVITDNWYTSFAMVVDGLRRGIYHVGTVKLSRKNNPIEFMFGKQTRGASPRTRGDCLVSACDLADDLGRVYCTAWQDKKAVHILSAFNAGHGFCNRMMKTAGVWTDTELPRPHIVGEYNAGMGGTDGMDQWISYINPRIKSTAWPNRIFIHMFMVAVTNAYIIYFWLHKKGKVEPKVPGGPKTDMRYGIAAFVGELAEELAGVSLAAAGGAKKDIDADEHVAEQCWNPSAGERNSADHQYLRGLCHQCKLHKVRTYCAVCGKYFCITRTVEDAQTCWTKHHNPVETSPKLKSSRSKKN